MWDFDDYKKHKNERNKRGRIKTWDTNKKQSITKGLKTNLRKSSYTVLGLLNFVVLKQSFWGNADQFLAAWTHFGKRVVGQKFVKR